MTEVFSYEKIEKLADRIRNMRNKKYKNDLIQIKNIIVSNNPDISMIKNNNGYLAPEFEKLSCSTYVKLTDYFDKMDERREESESERTQSDYYQYSRTDEFSEKNINKKLKYTNSENHILNKLKYEKALKQHQSECEEKNMDDDHIRIKNLSKLKKDKKSENDGQCEKIFKKHSKN